MKKEKNKTIIWVVHRENLFKTIGTSIIFLLILFGGFGVSVFFKNVEASFFVCGISLGFCYPVIFGITQFTWGLPFKKVEENKTYKEMDFSREIRS